MAALAAAVLAAALAFVPAGSAATPQALPKHQLTGYWQNFVNNAKPLKISDISPNYDVIALAFGNADSARPGAVTFNADPELSAALGGYSDEQLRSDIAAKRAEGKTFVLSIGGEKGNVDLGSEANAANFVDSVEKILTDYGINGLDIDLEYGLNVPNTTSAIRQLRERMGDGFVLTMAPQTLDVQSGGSYLQLIDNVKDILTVVHTQYYNSGSMNGCDGQVYSQGSADFITAQACSLLKVLRPDQVSLGLPAAASAAGSGYVDPSIVNNALSCLAVANDCGLYTPDQPHPEISGVMTWSINWDASSGNAFSDPVRTHLDSLP
ncbi:chitinase [Saccharopolyspora sp. ASAGF58]|uniref:chitinase n=1 Tax=Saccharopolyspora sp. ASAGF58 TaxID=2719023 RepID=UPI00143FD834|nr:chitinase [Saccharopolyspora sp. ASAGF58]QIZ36920.1 chitinase [Saccharopolyspora sp. ASAGF58]